jgi:hypothetical protein
MSEVDALVQDSKNDSPERKRSRKLDDDTAAHGEETTNESHPSNHHESFHYLQRCLLLNDDPLLPQSLAVDPPVKQNIHRLQQLLQEHGFRTSLVTSPRPGVSVYKDSAQPTVVNGTVERAGARRFLLILLGLDKFQEQLEKEYQSTFRSLWCLSLFCRKIRQAYFPRGSEDNQDALVKDFETELTATEKFCRDSLSSATPTTDSVDERVATMISLAVTIKNTSQRRHRAEEWEREYEHICATNCTLSNVHLTMFLSHHQLWVHDVVFKPGPLTKFERITVFLCDPNNDACRPPTFLLVPSLHTILNSGIQSMVSAMVEFVWSHLVQLGYFASPSITMRLMNQLIRFFLSGFLPHRQITCDDIQRLPLSLRARFDPSLPLSAYLYGCAGSGKSSFARFFPIALQETLTQFADPECVVRIVKQNLNKTMQNLELELELRPNNNDMSLMSIIQSRKQKMSQSKRGLVVLNMEEMPKYGTDNNPDQLSVAKLICHRFGGRKGDYCQCVPTDAAQRPRNSSRLSIGDDCSLITIFTSNYPLYDESRAQLRDLGIFAELVDFNIIPLSGSDRTVFVKKYFEATFQAQDHGRHEWLCRENNVKLVLDSGAGDTRPLVQTLRMFAYYLWGSINDKWSKLLELKSKGKVTQIEIHQMGQRCSIVLTVGDSHTEKLTLVRCTDIHSGCWFPLQISHDETKLDEFLKLWKARALAPAVLLSRSKEKSEELMDSLATDSHCHCIRGVHVDRYKMSKSLYDPKNTPNLRDDILKFGRGALVAVELVCPTEHSQLLVREMIEDSPSLTAFSSPRSALYKDGLLFILNVNEDLTPEVASRVSFEL